MRGVVSEFTSSRFRSSVPPTQITFGLMTTISRMCMPRSSCIRGLFSSSGIRGVLRQYSVSAKEPACSQSHIMVDYFINSLGFSNTEAVSALTEVSHLKSTRQPDLVVDHLKECGLDRTEIKDMISCAPKILLCNVDKTLKPKFKVLQELCISRPNLLKVISADRSFFSRGLDTRLIPSIQYLRKLLGSDEKVIKAVSKSKWLLNSVAGKFPPNLLLLQKFGIAHEKISKIIIQNPRFLMQKPEWLEDIFRRVEEDLGIPRDSSMFIYGVEALSKVNKSTIEMKYKIYRSFGWSDSDISIMTRIMPCTLCISEAKMRDNLNFYMKELGYDPAYLATRPKLLAYNLKKRVMPRYEVLKILTEKKLLKKMSLYTAVCQPEVKFRNDYVIRHKDQVPYLFEIYTKSMGI